MKLATIIGGLLLASCGQSPLEVSYEASLNVAKADCIANGGDEFMPFGVYSWVAVARLEKPMSFKCSRLEITGPRGVAVYVFRIEKDRIAMNKR